MSKLVNVTASIDKPAEMVEFASELKRVIVEQKLYTNIQGKNFPHVEAWQFCGAVMGVVPVLTMLVRVQDEEHIKYRAEIELHRISNDAVVGASVALCSSEERGRSKQDEYVISSMAQTRAVSKAYRNTFGWLMKLAGYEATPAEEMNDDIASESKKKDIKDEYEKRDE